MLRKLWFNLAYFQKPIWDTGISPPELQHFISDHSPGRALELGCGTGTNAIKLAKSVWQVTGVDFALRAIRMAEKKAVQNGVKVDFRSMDVTQMSNIFGCFDLILDIGCLHSLPPGKRLKYINKIDHYLSQGATYMLYVFFKNRDIDFGPGVTEDVIRTLSASLELVQRKDNTERGIRPSAWFWFQKQE